MVGDDALRDLSVGDAARLIAGGAITSEALVSDSLASLAAQGAKAFAQLQSESAAGDARIADERQRSGLPLASMHGVPVAITVDLAAA
jgi:Asp-tRNA(Asn)/Glu-tRNA(Gln) amidotransferase A subunit family amidase